MALFYQTVNSVGPGVRITLASNDDLVVGAGALVGATTSAGVRGLGFLHEVTVLGTVSGLIDGIQLGSGGAVDFGNVVRIASTGVVIGASSAVDFDSTASQLINQGSILSNSDGVEIGGVGDGTSRIVNSGQITGGSDGIEVNFGTTETIVVVNTGTIEGRSTAFAGGDNVDSIINRGTLIGDVFLLGGADQFDNRGGTLIGSVFGGDGDDTFFAGDGAEDFDGGLGFDSLDFRGGTGVTVSLRDNSGTGWAEGDIYVGIERVVGSRGSADVIVGDDLNNAVVGLGGADVLQGFGGADRVNGGGGVDRLRGGLGNDLFVYGSPEEGGDVILDYGNVAGNNDSFGILVSNFGAGLVLGALAPARFRSRPDNVAQDADDRFVFRTTDATLWFDANGNGAGGLTLLADLQAGVALSSADILLI